MPVLARKDDDSIATITKRYARKADASVVEVDAILARNEDGDILPVFHRLSVPTLTSVGIAPPEFRSEVGNSGRQIQVAAICTGQTSQSCAMRTAGGVTNVPLAVSGNALSGSIAMPDEDADFTVTATNAEGSTHGSAGFRYTTDAAITYFREGAGAHTGLGNETYYLEFAYAGHPIRSAVLTSNTGHRIDLRGNQWALRYPPSGTRLVRNAGRTGSGYAIVWTLTINGGITGAAAVTATVTVRISA